MWFLCIFYFMNNIYINGIPTDEGENFYIKNQSNGISCAWVNGKINGKENPPWT